MNNIGSHTVKTSPVISALQPIALSICNVTDVKISAFKAQYIYRRINMMWHKFPRHTN